MEKISKRLNTDHVEAMTKALEIIPHFVVVKTKSTVLVKTKTGAELYRALKLGAADLWAVRHVANLIRRDKMTKIAIITLDAEKDEHLVAWVRDDMTIKSFCGDHVMVLQDAKKYAGIHLVTNQTYAGVVSFLNFAVTIDRNALYWDYDPTGGSRINCRPGTKVRPIEKPPETAQPELTYSGALPNQEGWYWMRTASGFEVVKRVFIHSNEELSTWAVSPVRENTIMPIGRFKDVQWAGPIAKPGGTKHA